jgi:hypothetical protein
MYIYDYYSEISLPMLSSSPPQYVRHETNSNNNGTGTELKFIHEFKQLTLGQDMASYIPQL